MQTALEDSKLTHKGRALTVYLKASPGAEQVSRAGEERTARSGYRPVFPVVPPSSQDEALSRYSVSGEVPR